MFQAILTGFASVGAGWLAFLIGKHGLAWVAARLKARALRVEAALTARAETIASPLEGRLAALEADIAAIKPKVGL